MRFSSPAAFRYGEVYGTFTQATIAIQVMDKLSTLSEYIDWAKRIRGVDFTDTQHLTLYHYNAQTAHNVMLNHPFIKGLPTQLTKWSEEYKADFGSDLLMENSTLELDEKSYDSAVNKSFRENIISNEQYPEPPEKGWATPQNLLTYINDGVRGSLVCKFIDGPSYLSDRLAKYAEILGLKYRRYSQEKDEGYYAYHFYAGFSVTLLEPNGSTREAVVNMEIQVTTQLQDVLRSLTHRFYEERRLQSEVDRSKWKWDYASNRFKVGYLSHALHLLEAVIVESRNAVHGSLQTPPDTEGRS